MAKGRESIEIRCLVNNNVLKLPSIRTSFQFTLSNFLVLIVITLLWIIFTFLIWKAAVTWNCSRFSQLLNHNDHVILAEEQQKPVCMRIHVRKDRPQMSRFAVLKALFHKHNELDTPSPLVHFLGITFKPYPGSDLVLPRLTLTLRTSSGHVLHYCNLV